MWERFGFSNSRCGYKIMLVMLIRFDFLDLLAPRVERLTKLLC